MNRIDPRFKTSTYHVQPLISVDAAGALTIRYNYFDADNKQVAAPTAQYLRADFQGGNGDFVAFRHWSSTQEQQHGVPPSTAGYSAVLYAAVAKTLGDGAQVPNFVLANENGVIIPIYKGTIRGVILIFQIYRDGKFVKLAASPDPEIGNSTNGI